MFTSFVFLREKKIVILIQREGSIRYRFMQNMKKKQLKTHKNEYDETKGAYLV